MGESRNNYDDAAHTDDKRIGPKAAENNAPTRSDRASIARRLRCKLEGLSAWTASLERGQACPPDGPLGGAEDFRHPTGFEQHGIHRSFDWHWFRRGEPTRGLGKANSGLRTNQQIRSPHHNQRPNALG